MLKKTKIQIITCEHCGNESKYSKPVTQEVYTLKCIKCGSEDYEEDIDILLGSGWLIVSEDEVFCNDSCMCDWFNDQDNQLKYIKKYQLVDKLPRKSGC